MRNTYRIVRGVLFATVVTVAAIWFILYTLLSIPPVQDWIKGEVQKELSSFLGTEVTVGSLEISPFNELGLKDIRIKEINGATCLKIDRIAAGIRLWRLLMDGEIEISFAEIIGLDVSIVQEKEGDPLNIAFIIDSFKPKDNNKSPNKFELNIHTVILRNVSASFDRKWKPVSEDTLKFDANHFRIFDLKADIDFPKISENEVDVELHRMTFCSTGGFKLDKLSFIGKYTPGYASLDNLKIVLPGSNITLPQFKLNFSNPTHIKEEFENGMHVMEIKEWELTPSDFSAFLPVLLPFDVPLTLSADIRGNVHDVSLDNFSLTGYDGTLFMSAAGNYSDSDGNKVIDLKTFKARVPNSFFSVIEGNTTRFDNKLKLLLQVLKFVEADACGNLTIDDLSGKLKTDFRTSIGGISAETTFKNLRDGHGKIKGRAEINHLDIGKFVLHDKLGKVTAEVETELELGKGIPDGKLDLTVGSLQYLGQALSGIEVNVDKTDGVVNGLVTIDNEIANAAFEGELSILESTFGLDAIADIRFFNPGMLGVKGIPGESTLSGKIEVNGEGTQIDDLTGKIALNDFSLVDHNKGKSLELKNLSLEVVSDTILRTAVLRSDWIDGSVKGDFKFKELPGELKSISAKILPALIEEDVSSVYSSDLSFELNIKPDNSVPEYMNLPFRFLVPFSVKGGISGKNDIVWLETDIPYLQQGKNKLVSATNLSLLVDGRKGNASIDARTTFPAKKGDMNLVLGMTAHDNSVLTDIIWDTPSNSSFNGKLQFGAKISKNYFSGQPDFNVEISPSSFDFGTAEWHVDRGTVSYADRILNVDGLKVWHDRQFVSINGTASSLPTDSISISLADIDLDYVFDTLNINYVSFGGIATGNVFASEVFGNVPTAYTDALDVKNLSYNGTVLGDAVLTSRWNNEGKSVEIGADITTDEGLHTYLEGGIWVTRDSLSFDVDAKRVPIGFLKPFMAAFAEDVGGRASGKAKLFGTFKDIDLTGKLFADSIGMKLGFTNVAYHGTDSVEILPGRIVIPSFRLYDRNGRSALLSGVLTHKYFHDPFFNFRVSDAKRLLVYDTNSKINPDWYGLLYGNGSATVKGKPGEVAVGVDMTIAEDSKFTFVLNDTQAASDYHFLTFSDKRKEEAEKLAADTIPPALAALKRKMVKTEEFPSTFKLDIRASVSPVALFTLVMDPVAGDKLSARGNGNLQIEYDTESDEMLMYGKYTLDEGTYNFSLQDLILRDFAIKRGSGISFNGNPLDAQLDITAAYRVNTNLSDLDKSFSNDRDLTRTNVPVDALLMVNGPMQHPDITFDIELPTLTQDVTRKVKSIISTDDMMSRQIIYLLALNRFYTPEYMGSSSNGSEFASVASSTLSSQLSNILGQLTDKFSVAPSFRSDKGDFSDLEVDVALTSRLLNNRLLMNGNFGYRDKATSTTTFVGDFDIEYLLNRNGNFRLKAYNHFNDQNYYLRQALTTQGMGVVFRKDFDNPFRIKNKKEKK